MNKQKLILPASILIGCLIIGSFYYLIENRKLVAITEQDSRNEQADLFSRNVECGKLIKGVEDELNGINNDKPLIREIALTKLFYSKKVDACLYVAEYYSHEIADGPYLIKLVNALTKENVLSFAIGLPGVTRVYYNEDGSRNPEGWEKLDKARQEIEAYK